MGNASSSADTSHRLVARAAVFDDLSRNELIVNLSHRHRIVSAQDRGSRLDQLARLLVPAHGPNHRITALSGVVPPGSHEGVEILSEVEDPAANLD
jgi:hypothetical protein